jgi:hypothetical protein
MFDSYEESFLLILFVFVYFVCFCLFCLFLFILFLLYCFAVYSFLCSKNFIVSSLYLCFKTTTLMSSKAPNLMNLSSSILPILKSLSSFFKETFNNSLLPTFYTLTNIGIMQEEANSFLMIFKIPI